MTWDSREPKKIFDVERGSARVGGGEKGRMFFVRGWGWGGETTGEQNKSKKFFMLWGSDAGAETGGRTGTNIFCFVGRWV